MKKNKPKIVALRKSWKYPKDFDSLTFREQVRFCWWQLTGSSRGLLFIFLQVQFGQDTREAFDKAKRNDKMAIVLTLANSGYYHYSSCC